MNITELARKLKITPKELKEELPKMGFHIGKRAIQIPDKQAEKVIDLWQEKKEKEKVLSKIKDKITQTSEEEKGKENKKEKIILPPDIQVYRLAEKLDLPVTKIMNELMKNGVLVSVNESLDYEIAAIIAEKLGFETELGEKEKEIQTISLKSKLKKILKGESKENLKSRAPVVVMMGHVDHGKSSILDTIRKSKIVDGEKGGITQHIGAYQVQEKDHPITFIDTPGHEAFKTMRARGGEIADIAVLVIAADDGVQPQTLESIKIVQQEQIPLVAAINKIDKAEADIEKVKKDLSKINLMPEDWGGKVVCVPLSAKTGKGIDNLLETINLISEMEEDNLVSDPQGELLGIVIEAHLDSAVGSIASIIIYNGTLKQGDNVIIGESYGRVRSIKDQTNTEVKQIQASQPAQIFGLKGLPQAGDLIEVIKDSKEFKKRVKDITPFSEKGPIISYQEKNQEEKSKDKSINLIIRVDVLGSLEAIEHSLNKLKNPEVKIKILKKGLGNLTEADVELAKTAKAWLISFGTRISKSAQQLAEEMSLKVSHYYIIYDLIDDIKKEVNKILPPDITEKKIGRVEVLKVFQKTNKETILGARVTKGKIIQPAIARVWGCSSQEKEPELKGEGKIAQLQINKKDVSEVKLGSEFGVKLISKVKIELGDILEIYQEIKKEKKI